jgi:hypothetical protein
MKWLIALDVLLYIGAVILFFNGLGVLALICIILAALLTLILLGISDNFSWFMVFDGLTDIFD